MTATLRTVTEADFESTVLQSPIPVLVDFFTTWCGPCKVLAPTLEDLAQELKATVSIVSVDAEASPVIAERYGVTGYPTLVLFSGGVEVSRPRPGTRRDIRAVLEQTLGADADQPRTDTTADDDDDPVPAPVTEIIRQFESLDEAAWARVGAYVTDAMQTHSGDPSGMPVDEEELTRVETRLGNEVDELAVTRGAGGALPEAIASAAQAAFDVWVRQRRASSWASALRTVPGARMSPYLPGGEAGTDLAAAASAYVENLRALSDEEWVHIRRVNRDLWPFADHGAAVAGWLGAVLLLQVETSAELVEPRVRDICWEPFTGLVARTDAESA